MYRGIVGYAQKMNIFIVPVVGWCTESTIARHHHDVRYQYGTGTLLYSTIRTLVLM